MNALVTISSALEQRKALAENPASLEGLQPVERSLFLSTLGKPVSQYSATELAAELDTILRYVAKDVGFRPTNDSDVQYIVIRTTEILRRYYPNFTLKDFRLAFEMSLTGELDDYLPKGRDGQPDRWHYQQFNAEYICKILGAYKVRRAKVIQKANDAVVEKEPEVSREEVEKLLERENEIMLETFRYYQNEGRFPYDMTPITELICYRALEKRGLVESVQITPEEQREILARTINQYARSGNVGDMERLKRAGKDAPELQPKAYTLARRNALRRAFDKIISENIEL